jgi:hypothetical protein
MWHYAERPERAAHFLYSGQRPDSGRGNLLNGRQPSARRSTTPLC